MKLFALGWSSRMKPPASEFKDGAGQQVAGTRREVHKKAAGEDSFARKASVLGWAFGGEVEEERGGNSHHWAEQLAKLRVWVSGGGAATWLAGGDGGTAQDRPLVLEAPGSPGVFFWARLKKQQRREEKLG